MSKYIYGWNSLTHKKEYRGKYPDANPRGQGYFGRNDAGDIPEFIPKEAGEKLGFIGSYMNEYVFFNKKHGTRTITAKSYEEALRIARSLGYTGKDYQKR